MDVQEIPAKLGYKYGHTECFPDWRQKAALGYSHYVIPYKNTLQNVIAKNFDMVNAKKLPIHLRDNDV